MRKKWWLIPVTVILAVVVAAGGLIAWLSVTEYRPDPVEPAEVVKSTDGAILDVRTLTVLAFNMGYAGLGSESDFFMDGGEQTFPDSAAVVEKNLDGVIGILENVDADVMLLQEVDRDSRRSFRIDQVALLGERFGYCAYACNYRCAFVPIPLPPLGKVDSGLVTLTDYAVADAERIALPCPFSWPLRTANLKRCLLVTRMPLAGTDQQLVLVNLHLEAYDSGEGRRAQLAALSAFLVAEAECGNYVIAGGDFNTSFPDTLDRYPVIDPETWQPGALTAAEVVPFSPAFDAKTPTCRLLNFPYDPANPLTQYYVIDGFLVSDNVLVDSVETLDAGFLYSDHNPVLLTVTLEGVA